MYGHQYLFLVVYVVCIDKVQKKLADALFLNVYVIPAYCCVGEAVYA